MEAVIDLRSWVRDHRIQGYSDREIHDYLHEQGYAEDQILQATRPLNETRRSKKVWLYVGGGVVALIGSTIFLR